jgi:GNAT superfamily N-acetyltransferase
MIRNRTARRDEIDLILRWAADEGWNPGLDDADAFFATDADGFFVAEANGAPVAAISVVIHSSDFAFLGLYLCRPDWRGKGIGHALWRHALAHAGGRTVGLDGVAAQEANYAKSGFLRTGATRRLEGQLAPQGAVGIRAAAPEDMPALIAIDAAANGVARPAFLTTWLASRATRRTVVLSGPDGPQGFATARLCRRGCKVGPVVAPVAGTALALIRAALAAVGSDEAIVDVPDARDDFAQRLTDMGFTETFATARMYRGPAPRAGATLMAIATMELG